MKKADANISALTELIARLRDPETGCPWDLKQTSRSMVGYLLEETYEAIEAVEAGDDEHLREELGDLLFVVAFQAHLAEERGAFTLSDSVAWVCEKMVERHPHVFDPGSEIEASEVPKRWELAKRKTRKSVLDGVPTALPALQRAHRLTVKAGSVGFDWECTDDVMKKLDEEVSELREALETGDPDRVEDELGDVLFVLANLGRKEGISAEGALRRTMAKFLSRFEYIETRLAQRGSSPDASTLEEMDALWNEAKDHT